jgi:signal transduction histidine kinase
MRASASLPDDPSAAGEGSPVRGYHLPVAVGSHLQDRGHDVVVAALRGTVAALALLHVALILPELRAAGLVVPAVAAIALLAASTGLGFFARRLRGLGATLALGCFDLVALVTMARITVDVDPTASIVWAFVLWVPFSIALRAGGPAALAATIVASGAVLVADLLSVGVLDPVDRAWTTLAVPSLLVLVGGVSILAASVLQRRGDEYVQRELLSERDRSSRLREADELKNTFLAAVSHELRSPLTSILGFSLTLLDREDLEPAQRDRMLRTIVLEAEHLEDILANLLDLDRLTRGKATLVPVELDPARVVNTAVEHVQRRSGRQVLVDLDAGVRACLDAAKVERIVENLVGNAVKYTPADADIVVTMHPDRSGIRIRVDDAGPGIGSDLRDRIFEPFRRGSDHGVPGTGIGLSLVDQFARMHGGKAWLEERPGGGCRFQVYLPSAAVASSRPTLRDGGGASSGIADAHRHVTVSSPD